MRFVLPLPPRELSPNVRSHWAKKAKAVKSYRLRAWVEARNATNAKRLEWERAEVRTTFYLPDLRRRDPDNLMAAMKAAWDGIVDAHVLTDDRYLITYPPTLELDRKRPRVVVDITEIAA